MLLSSLRKPFQLNSDLSKQNNYLILIYWMNNTRYFYLEGKLFMIPQIKNLPMKNSGKFFHKQQKFFQLVTLEVLYRHPSFFSMLSMFLLIFFLLTFLVPFIFSFFSLSFFFFLNLVEFLKQVKC